MCLFIGFYGFVYRVLFLFGGVLWFFSGCPKRCSGYLFEPPTLRPTSPPEGPYDKLQSALREVGLHFGLRVFRPGYSMAGKERFKPFGELN